jgi:hypothetical protein
MRVFVVPHWLSIIKYESNIIGGKIQKNYKIGGLKFRILK